MPRKPQVPKYGLHKPSGQARVAIQGKLVYLGPHGSAESLQKYTRLISERFLSAPEPIESDHGIDKFPSISINELLAKYWAYACRYYSPNGKPSPELRSMHDVLRWVRTLYTDLPAREFGPLARKAIRQYMVDRKLARSNINRQIGRIKRIFKWAVSEQLVPTSVFEGLRSVDGLRFGRTDARETEPVKPVAIQWVNAVLPHVAPPVSAMIQLQMLTGTRTWCGRSGRRSTAHGSGRRRSPPCKWPRSRGRAGRPARRRSRPARASAPPRRSLPATAM
jgi:hypothetical protein